MITQIIMGSWIPDSGYSMESSIMVLARRINHQPDRRNWALLRRFELGVSIKTQWEILRVYDARMKAQTHLDHIYQALESDGHKITPMTFEGDQEAPYENVDGFGAF